MNHFIEKTANLYFNNPVRSGLKKVSPYSQYGFYLMRNFIPRFSYYQRHEPAYVTWQTKYRVVPIVLAFSYVVFTQVLLANKVKAIKQRRLQESL